MNEMYCSSLRAKFIVGIVFACLVGLLMYVDTWWDLAVRYPHMKSDRFLRYFWINNDFSNSTAKGAALNTKHAPYLDNGTHIAIGGGITLRKLTPKQLADIVNGYHFFTHLLPSFCATVSRGEYRYHFYFGYDQGDQYFTNSENVVKFGTAFKAASKSCPTGLSLTLSLISCSHKSHPAWAQNDAMMAAYLDGMEYFYRINDDTRFDTKGWTEIFIKTLDQFQPPRVGVVGPTHDWGNTAILTYDFVHRAHIDIFGFYYPHSFTDWYSDTWITKVYGANRMKKVPEVKLHHSHEQGTRYNPNTNLGKLLPGLLNSCTAWLNYFIKAVTSDAYNGTYNKLIVMSITELTAAQVYGAIRNAQLVPVFYSDGWTLRVYIPLCNSDINMDSVKRTLQRLRAEVISEPCSADNTSAYINAFHSLTETAYTHVIVRSPLFRFSDREAQAVKDWIKSNTTFHIIRDHPSHLNLSVVPQLWGMRTQDFHRNIIKSQSLSNLLADIPANNSSESSVLFKFILPFASNSVFESVTQSLPKAALPYQNSSMGVCCTSLYLGQTFNEHMILS